MKALMYKTYHLANAAEHRIWRAHALRVFYSMYSEDLVGFAPNGTPRFEPNE